VVRKTLGLKVSEIPDFTTKPQVEAIPVFRDDNITVFSIPIVPMPRFGDGSSAEPGVLSEADASENILKRKREDSPESPSKRPFLDSTVPTSDGLSTPTMNPSPLLGHLLSNPMFDPATLEGNEAEAWRRLIIDHMFTWVELPPKPRPPPISASKKGKRGQNADDGEMQPSSQVDTSLASLPQVPHWNEDTTAGQGKPLGRGPKGMNPAGSLKSLPTFTPPIRYGSTAYIVVGPRVRGKFDVKRAEELGLYGPLRGKVARGETVTFTVDDGAGGSVQRTVRPENCIGEHETTKVRFPTSSPGFMC
jgi:ribonuclease Z